MARSQNREENTRTYQDRSTQTTVEEEGWLVRGLALTLRLFFIFFVAFARAVVTLAGDTIPDTFVDRTIPAAVVDSLGPFESVLYTTASAPEGSRTSPLQGYYIVFIGREVGYTTNSALLASLVQDVPNNYWQKFDTLDQAIRAYEEAVQCGRVRRIRPVIQPSGHVQFIYDHLSIDTGIRNLDEPHLPPQPLTPTTFPSDPLPPTPSTSATLTGSTVATSESPASVAASNEPMWDMVDIRGGYANANVSTEPTPTNVPAGMPSSRTVIFLDSDEDIAESSILANNTALSSLSAHSSDVYYADKTYDLAFAAYIEEEERNEASVEAGPSS